MRNIDFKDTDKKLEISIYDEKFEVNINKLEKINKDEINDESDLNKILDEILGNGACDRLNKKRKEAGYSELDNGNGLAIFSAIIEEYVRFAMTPVNNIFNEYEKVENKTNQYMNRNQRRNYNRNNRNGRNNKRYY